MSKFNLVMISAGFEHGGNVTHRHLDGHPDLLVYPFESQLGNREFNDYLASLERVQYRYPEFPEGLSPSELYESIIDEEMKTFLRKRNGSKFKDANLILNEQRRKDRFIELLGTEKSFSRANVIEAFFRSTFDAWENLHNNIGKNSIYVGYSPAIGIDAPRMIKDFPEIKIIHVIRNPFSAYFDTKRRPFPQPLVKYMITWNVYHSTVDLYSKLFPENVKIVRYEDMVADKATFMKELCHFIGIDFNSSLMYPSWNGIELKGDIAPWGTVLRSTEDYNKEIISNLDESELATISHASAALAKHFKYDQVSYLKALY